MLSHITSSQRLAHQTLRKLRNGLRAQRLTYRARSELAKLPKLALLRLVKRIRFRELVLRKA